MRNHNLFLFLYHHTKRKHNTMKKALSISGTISFSRKEIIELLTKHVKEIEQLVVERAICVDEKQEACKFEEVILYVHQAGKDPITKKYDGPQKHKVPTGVIARPNYGVGKFMKELLDDNEVHTLDEIYNEVKAKFPKMTKKITKHYLDRPPMVGEVVKDGDTYLRVPKDKKK